MNDDLEDFPYGGKLSIRGAGHIDGKLVDLLVAYGDSMWVLKISKIEKVA